MPYPIDSDVLIDISRGNPAALDHIDALPEGWAISQISALELIVGARNKLDMIKLDNFLPAYVVVPLHPSAGSRAYELLKRYAKSHGLHVFDALVAAIAMEEGLMLVTRNRKHFEMIDGLKLEIPPYR